MGVNIINCLSTGCEQTVDSSWDREYEWVPEIIPNDHGTLSSE